MARTNIHGHDEHGTWRILTWFDPGKAKRYDEATWWDGSNNISVATSSQWESEGSGC